MDKKYNAYSPDNICNSSYPDGIMMFIFAILSDLIVSMHRENMRTMRKIIKEMEKS